MPHDPHSAAHACLVGFTGFTLVILVKTWGKRTQLGVLSPYSQPATCIIQPIHPVVFLTLNIWFRLLSPSFLNMIFQLGHTCIPPPKSPRTPRPDPSISEVKSEHPEAENAPLILWSNGGPGCTSMEGAATEIGPPP